MRDASNRGDLIQASSLKNGSSKISLHLFRTLILKGGLAWCKLKLETYSEKDNAVLQAMLRNLSFGGLREPR